MALSIIRNITQRIFGTGQDKFSVKEGADELQGLLNIELSEEEIVLQVNTDMQSAMPLYKQMRAIQDDNEKYYLGTQLDQSLFSYEIPTAENLLYMAVETILSIITSRKREPIVLAAQENDESRDLKEKTQQYLTWKWHDEDMEIKFEDWVRHAMIYRIGILKIRYDEKRDDYEIVNVRPQRIMIDKDATDEYNARFIIEFRDDTLGDLLEMFPKAKQKLTEAYGEQLGTKITYVEYWTNEFVVWKVGGIILDKKKNPNWDWDEKDRAESLNKMRKRWADKTQKDKLKNILLNYFNEPRKPFIILSLKNLNNSIYSDTTDFEQGKVVQDLVNKRKRQIDKHAMRSLGREVYSGQVLDKNEAKKAIANPNAPLWITRGNASNAVTFLAPQPMSPSLMQDLQDSKQALDNVMGTHGTTRGEQGANETARGRTILREGDFGRIDMMNRRIDKKIELLYGWMCQMTKVWYNEAHFVKLLGRENAEQYLQYSQDDMEDGIEVMVKSEITVNKALEREQMGERLKAKMIDPLTFFEKTDEPKPKEMARRFIYYTLDPKLYLATFAVDENTEGAENDPVVKAKQEQVAIMKGEQIQPFAGVTADHLQEHSKFMQSGKFRGQEIEIQQFIIDHVRSEAETLKGMAGSV